MKVLIHALAALETGGSERHLRGMLSSLVAADPGVEYQLYVSTAFPIHSVPKNVTVRSVPIRGLAHRLWWDQVVFPRVTAQARADAVWATLSFGMLRPPAPQIVFQRNAMYYCDTYLKTLRPTESLMTRFRRALLYGAMRSSCRIIAPTAAMRQMIRHFHPDLPADRFEVMPHPFDPLTARGSLTTEVSRVMGEGPAGTVRCLYVGHILSYKALPFLLEAFRLAVDRSPRPLRLYLTIAQEDWPQGYDAFLRRVAELKLGGCVVVLGKVPGEMVDALYRASDILVFPSLCESFGFPLVEAQAYGVPIVAADTPVNREMAGTAAVYYAPDQVEGAALALLSLAEDERLRHLLVQAGRGQFAERRTTWIEYSRRCLALSREGMGCAKR